MRNGNVVMPSRSDGCSGDEPLVALGHAFRRRVDATRSTERSVLRGCDAEPSAATARGPLERHVGALVPLGSCQETNASEDARVFRFASPKLGRRVGGRGPGASGPDRRVTISTRPGGQLPLGASRFYEPLALGLDQGHASWVDMADGQVEQIEVLRHGGKLATR